MRIIRIIMALCALGMFLAGAPQAMAQDTSETAKPPRPVERTIAPLGQAAPVPRACTQMWCMEGYTLQLNANQWPQGYYNFKIIADENVYSCEGQLPLPTCGVPAITCNDKAVQIGESGCALPADAHSFHALMLSKIPDNIVVSVTGPTGTFTHESKVEKKCGYPNGEGCDPRACCSAVENAYINW